MGARTTSLRHVVLCLWRLFDPLYFGCTRLCKVDDGCNVFRVRLLKYRGTTLELADGTSIRRGDLLLKIHLHNVRLLSLLSDCQTALARTKQVYRSVQQSLPGLAEYIRQHPQGRQIRGLLGLTQLNRACVSLGFEVHEIDNRWLRRLKWWTLLPIRMLASEKPWRAGARQQPKLLLMSCERLFARYAPQSQVRDSR